jgi:hypothetical protein
MKWQRYIGPVLHPNPPTCWQIFESCGSVPDLRSAGPVGFVTCPLAEPQVSAVQTGGRATWASDTFRRVQQVGLRFRRFALPAAGPQRVGPGHQVGEDAGAAQLRPARTSWTGPRSSGWPGRCAGCWSPGPRRRCGSRAWSTRARSPSAGRGCWTSCGSDWGSARS